MIKPSKVEMMLYNKRKYLGPKRQNHKWIDFLNPLEGNYGESKEQGC